MTVYIELAFLENFLLDALLLWLALLCTRQKVKVWRLCLASAVGATEAVVFPLIPFPVWAAYFIKFLGGALLAVIASSKGIKNCLLTVASFFALTFAYGGLLTAAYSFFNVKHEEGNGYLVEQAPVALVLCGAIAFFVAAALGAKRFYRFQKLKRQIVPCVLCVGEKRLQWQGFLDSGNLLSFRGQPVCVISAAGVFALFGARPKSVGRIAVKTVNGEKEAPVFVCDSLKAGGRSFREVYFTVGDVPTKNYQLILHTTFTEGEHEDFKPVEELVEKNGGL